MVGEAAVMADLGKALGGAHDEVAGFLNPQVAQVFLGGHAEAGFELAEKTAEGKIGCLGESGDRDVLAEVFVEEVEGGSEFFVLSQGGGALFEGARDSDDAANLALLIEEGFLGGGGPIDESRCRGGRVRLG